MISANPQVNSFFSYFEQYRTLAFTPIILTSSQPCDFALNQSASRSGSGYHEGDDITRQDGARVYIYGNADQRKTRRALLTK